MPSVKRGDRGCSMTVSYARQSLGGLIYLALAFALGAYFTFAAVQGDYGVFRQVEIKAEAEVLTAERDKLAAELAEMTNLTRRLSDGYLDLDLLDQQARDILGYVRSDEIIIR
jgi:cell division protein FtsB